MPQIRRIRLILLSLVLIFANAFGRSEFEKLGDALTLLPAPVGVVSESMEDYMGVLQLFLGTLATQGAIEGVKRSFEFAHKQGHSIAFAKRPCCDDYKGMPSGHAGGAMSAAAFVFYRYGWESALPLIALSVTTSASRVYARKHSVWQVLVGSAIAWGFAALFTTPYHPSKPYLFVPDNRPKRQFFVFPIVGRDRNYSMYYGLKIYYVF